MVVLPTYEKSRGAASDCCVSTAKTGHVAITGRLQTRIMYRPIRPSAGPLDIRGCVQ